MKGVQIRRNLAVAACAMLAVALGGCALLAPPSPQSAPPAEPARTAGGKTFDKWCGDCHHSAQGPGSLAMQRKYRGNVPAILEQRNDLPAPYIMRVVRQGISFMPSFRKTEISDDDLALLAAYLAPSQRLTQ
jgi:mono/diheme cytochrome c family protein